MNSSPSLPTGQRVVVTELGETPTEAIDRFIELQDMPPPDVSTLAATDVLIGVRACSVGWVDLIMSSGQYQHVNTPPYVPGLEYAGEVLWAGPDCGPDVQLGARVLVDGLIAGPRSKGPYQRWGGMATYAVAPAAAAIPIPGALTYAQACNLLGNYETAYHCLVTRGQLKTGETLLVLGASGSTGLAAVQIARLLGVTVIAVGRSAAKLEIVGQEGAHHVLATVGADGEARNLRDDVKALTDGRGVDAVYDPVGGDLSLEALRCLRFGGRFLIVGWAGTPYVSRGKGQRGAPNANQLPTNLIMMKGVDVLGCPMVISTVNNPALRPPRLAQVMAWAGAGDIVPRVAREWPLAQFREAMLAKWRGGEVGGCVILVGQPKT